MQRLIIIQYLRAIAAIGVAIFHATGALHGMRNWAPGALGVDLFFVISGFVIIYSTTGAISPLHFLWRRWVRIAPLYILATTAAFAIAATFPSAMHHMSVTPWGYIKSVLFIPYIGRPAPVLAQGWTLNCEMFFYTLFAVSLFMPRRIGVPACAIILTLLAIIGRISPMGGPFLSMATNWRLGEFAIGMIPALVCTRWPALVMFDKYIPRWPPLLLLGNASYSIYLSYSFALALLVRLWVYVPDYGHPVTNDAFVVVAVAASIAAGIATYMFIERQLNRRARNWKCCMFTFPALPAIVKKSNVVPSIGIDME